MVKIDQHGREVKIPSCIWRQIVLPQQGIFNMRCLLQANRVIARACDTVARCYAQALVSSY